MAASISSTAAVGTSSVGVSSGKSARQPVALSIVGVSSRAFSAGESLLLTRRRPLEFIVAKSYGYGNPEGVGNSEWSPPPPANLDLSTEPSDGVKEFNVPEPDERDYSGGYGGFRSEPEPNTKLYVGNLPWSVDSAMLADCFKNAGIDDCVEVNVMFDRMTNKSRGFAFVTLASEESTKRAIEKLDGYEFEGRMLRVNYPQVPRGGGFGGGDGFSGGFGGRPAIPANPAKCFIANIPWSMDDQSLCDFFSSKGTVVDCRILTDAETGRSRGIGFVTFSTPEEATEAINTLDGAEMGGRSIRVALATGRS